MINDNLVLGINAEKYPNNPKSVLQVLLLLFKNIVLTHWQVAPKTLSSKVLLVRDRPDLGSKLDIYINKNTPLPCASTVHSYEPLKHEQTAVSIPVIEGESDDINHSYLLFAVGFFFFFFDIKNAKLPPG